MTDETTTPQSVNTSSDIDSAETAANDVAQVATDAKEAVEDLVKFSRIPTEGHGRKIIDALHALIDTVLGK